MLACPAQNTSLIRYQAKEYLMGDPYDTSAERTSVLGNDIQVRERPPW